MLQRFRVSGPRDPEAGEELDPGARIPPLQGALETPAGASLEKPKPAWGSGFLLSGAAPESDPTEAVGCTTALVLKVYGR